MKKDDNSINILVSSNNCNAVVVDYEMDEEEIVMIACTPLNTKTGRHIIGACLLTGASELVECEYPVYSKSALNKLTKR